MSATGGACKGGTEEGRSEWAGWAKGRLADFLCAAEAEEAAEEEVYGLRVIETPPTHTPHTFREAWSLSSVGSNRADPVLRLWQPRSLRQDSGPRPAPSEARGRHVPACAEKSARDPKKATTDCVCLRLLNSSVCVWHRSYKTDIMRPLFYGERLLFYGEYYGERIAGSSDTN